MPDILANGEWGRNDGIICNLPVGPWWIPRRFWRWLEFRWPLYHRNLDRREDSWLYRLLTHPCGGKTYLTDDQGQGLCGYDCEKCGGTFQVQYDIDDDSETDDYEPEYDPYYDGL